MNRLWLLTVSLVLVLACTVRAAAEAAVVVFANPTDEPVTFAIATPGRNLQAYRIAAGDVLPVPLQGRAALRYSAAGQLVDRPIVPSSICTFVRKGKLEVNEQRFGGIEAESAPSSPSSLTDMPLDPVGVFPVMILVDEDEPAVRRVWESRLRSRLADASKIFEHHCRMRLEVVAVDTWESNDGITDFALSLREFEQKVRLRPPARLAIGFTSQYQKPDVRRVHMGGTRGPLYPYLLVREWSQHISETERLEILVHELGHVLGASHSADETSVMRAVVGDRQSCARSFRIGFDPLNTLALYVFCEQLRVGGAARLDDFSASSRELLSRVYSEMQQQLPDDTAAARYLALIHRARRQGTTLEPVSLTPATQSVVRAVARAARANHARPAGQGAAAPLRGDELADYYIRAAAEEAGRASELVATKAFLLGLAVALDRSGGKDRSPLSNIFGLYETPQQREDRLAVLGQPTLRGREDLLEHFVVAAALCARLGPGGAEAMSTLKEISDSRGPSGFSFADLAADFAGIELATRLARSQLTLEELARSFEGRHFVPSPTALPENLSYDALKKTYGDASDPRFRQQNDWVRREVRAMAGFVRSPTD